MINRKKPTIYVGYDARDHQAYEVLVHSIEQYCDKFPIVPLIEPALRRAGLYRRTLFVDEANPRQKIDYFDRKPFSTDFTFTRFLVPALNQYSGLALFMDADMFVRADIEQIFDQYGSRSEYAVSCVKHKYSPSAGKKMDGVAQTQYHRKNWSSFMLFNCDHEKNKHLTVDDVNLKSGGWLHRLSWLDDDEVGSIHEEWNWLDGHSPVNVEAKNVHFTTGGPWFDNWKPRRKIDEEYAFEWKLFQDKIYTDKLMETLG